MQQLFSPVGLLLLLLLWPTHQVQAFALRLYSSDLKPGQSSTSRQQLAVDANETTPWNLDRPMQSYRKLVTFAATKGRPAVTRPRPGATPKPSLQQPFMSDCKDYSECRQQLIHFLAANVHKEMYRQHKSNSLKSANSYNMAAVLPV